jgi:two-component system OmpR family response regulator
LDTPGYPLDFAHEQTQSPPVLTRAAPHILVVDDDREIRTLVGRMLTQSGFRVSSAADGRQMLQLLAVSRVDLVVLDLMLPGEDGLSLCRKLRAKGNLPILMLTAMGEETDRIVGLEMGADDYLTKPFSARELLARIRAVLRRASALPVASGERAAGFAFAGWTLDVRRRELTTQEGTLLPLSNGEFDLLLAFVEHPDRVLTREQLLDLARGRNATVFDRAIDVQVGRLRRKIEADPAQPVLIRTVRNGGYLFTADVTAMAERAGRA